MDKSNKSPDMDRNKYLVVMEPDDPDDDSHVIDVCSNFDDASNLAYKYEEEENTVVDDYGRMPDTYSVIQASFSDNWEEGDNIFPDNEVVVFNVGVWSHTPVEDSETGEIFMISEGPIFIKDLMSIEY